MNKDELKQLGETLIAISEGAEWECMWEDGTWGIPLGRDLEYCVGHRIPIRLKPRTITVNGIEVPEPLMVKPEFGAEYYAVRPEDLEYYAKWHWNDERLDNLWLSRGLCHATAENAIQHAKAMLAGNGGANE